MNFHRVRFHQVRTRIFVFLIITLLSGCTSIFKSGVEDSEYQSDAQAAPSSNNATLALLDNASQQSEAGDLEAAAATIERALRIESRNPQLWHRLARVRFDQGKHKLAANLAAKSNSFAANDAILINKNRELIKQARLSMNK